MYSVEVELDVREPFLKIPTYERLKNKHVRVLFIAEDDQAESVTSRKLPDVYFNPVVVESYALIGKRDDWYER